MTIETAVPIISTLVEMTTSDEPVRGVRIDEIAGRRMTLSPPADAAATVGPGDQVVLHWAAGERGRWVVAGQVAETIDTRLVVELTAEPRIEQLRRFVRGGGGEQIRVQRTGSGDAEETAGWIRDISERSVRAQFAAVTIRDGERLRLTIYLEGNTIEVYGTAARITVRPPEAPGPDATRVEVVATFDADELQAQAVRRYVYRQQVLTRSRIAG
jgi:hypothetical protein